MNSTKMRPLLVELYGDEVGAAIFDQLATRLDEYRLQWPEGKARSGEVTQRDAILITYPDQVQEAGRAPLATLRDFCRAYFKAISGVHILPFYPWSSDDGFSVIDYESVDPRYGDWEDVRAMGEHFRLMLDAVINHVSVSSAWFQGWLRGEARFERYFIVPPDDADLTRVIRPRALPLLTSFATPSGERRVWTTFSADQADLNYKNPEVLLEVIDALLWYVAQGAEFLRLDAIAYLWKEPGTSSIHLPQTHRVIQLFRAVLDQVAPHVMLITETNVPHVDNISYFGDGTNEAQMVYNFSLPPLVLHAFHRGSAEKLSAWASGLSVPSVQGTFFNFLASHDGIGLNPLRGILPEAEITALVERIQAHGGLVSYRSEPDGSQLPYELNVNFFDALNDPHSAEGVDLQIERFVTAHAILLALSGLPALYFHSLVGSRGWLAGAEASGHNRTINRRKLQRLQLETQLNDPTSRPARVLSRLTRLLEARAGQPAFDPHGAQDVIPGPPGIFGLLRISPDGNQRVLCLHNVTDVAQDFAIDRASTHLGRPGRLTDITTGRELPSDPAVRIQACHFMWLT